MTDQQVGQQVDVDTALAALATAAVSTLANEMRSARNSKDRIAAANSILDRLGYGRTTRAQADVADDEIRRALEAVTEGNPKHELTGGNTLTPDQLDALVPPEHQDQNQDRSEAIDDPDPSELLGEPESPDDGEWIIHA